MTNTARLLFSVFVPATVLVVFLVSAGSNGRAREHGQTQPRAGDGTDWVMDTVDPSREDIDWDKESPGFKEYVKLVRRAIDGSDPQMCFQAKAYLYTPSNGNPVFHSSREESINTCLASYGRAKKDPDVCLRMNPYRVEPARRMLMEQLKEACLFEAQSRRGRFEKRFCQQIQNKQGWFFERCLQKLYEQTQDPELCRYFFESNDTGYETCRNLLSKWRTTPQLEQEEAVTGGR